MHRHGSVIGTCVVRLMRFTYIVLSIGGEGEGAMGSSCTVHITGLVLNRLGNAAPCEFNRTIMTDMLLSRVMQD